MQLRQTQSLNFDGGVIPKAKKLTTLAQKAFLTLHRRGVEINHSFSTLPHFSLRVCLVFSVVILFHSFGKTTNKNLRSLWMGMCANHSCCCAAADAFFEVNLICSSSKQKAVWREKCSGRLKTVLCLFRNGIHKRQHNEFTSAFVNIHNEIFPVLQILSTSQIDTKR